MEIAAAGESAWSLVQVDIPLTTSVMGFVRSLCGDILRVSDFPGQI
jgi:hypothetical protein